jgi:hypothetical protein
VLALGACTAALTLGAAVPAWAAAPVAAPNDQWATAQPLGDSWAAAQPLGDSWSTAQPLGDSWAADNPLGDGWVTVAD